MDRTLQTNIARTEHMVPVPTTYKGLGLLPKNEILPGTYLASELTRAGNGVCVTSIINTTETDETLDLPFVYLEGLGKAKAYLP